MPSSLKLAKYIIEQILQCQNVRVTDKRHCAVWPLWRRSNGPQGAVEGLSS